MDISREELLKVCKELNDKYVIQGRYFGDFGEHYSHKVHRLLKEALENNPDLGVDVEGEIVFDVTGGGVFVLDYAYINTGDPYVKTITWRNQDPMHPNVGCFRVEGWGDALEAVEGFRDEWKKEHDDDPEPDDGLVDDWEPDDDDGDYDTLDYPSLAAARI